MVQMVTLGRMVVYHFLSYYNKNDTIYGTLWIPTSFHHFFSKIKILGTTSGRNHLTMAQNRMKQQTDQHHNERSFEVGDWVFLRLQPYKQMSLKEAKKDNKLSPKYYGPYKVLQKIGTMVYKLELPASSRVHLVFHVSCLKKVIGDKIPVQTILQELDEEGKIILEPESITGTRIRQLRNRPISEYLIKWRKLPTEDSTWEDESLIHKHPELLKHCGPHFSQGEGHVKP
jgi:hypothetical protein